MESKFSTIRIVSFLNMQELNNFLWKLFLCDISVIVFSSDFIRAKKTLGLVFKNGSQENCEWYQKQRLTAE